MPAAKGGESKNGLVVTLVFFILLTIILGVLTYTGFTGQTALEEDKKKAAEAEKTAKEDRDWYKAQALMYRSYLGYPPNDAKGLDDLAVRHDQVKKSNLGSKAADYSESKKLLDKLENELGWNEATKKPQTDYLARIKGLERQLQERDLKLAEADQASKAAEAKHKREKENLKKEKENVETKLAEQIAGRKKDSEESNLKYDKRREDFDGQGKVIADKTAEFEQKLKEKDAEIAKQKKEIADLKRLVDKIKAKLAPIDPSEYSGPKGKIVLIDKTGTMPYINIGSADNVRPQLTFSIHGIGPDGRPIKESKGSLEVISVVNDHLSKCKVTQVVDAYRAPVVKGDVIMNAAWDPSMKRHVAIVGIIDLTGEARLDRPSDQMRSLQEFKRILENQNIVVDAYLDLEDLSIKGKGITRQTDFLIHGAAPDVGRITTKDDPRVKQRDDLLIAMEKMRKEAAINGVTIIELKKFLTMTGYKVPRAPQNGRDTQIHSALPQAGSPADKKK
jgi:hypothetical protein